MTPADCADSVVGLFSLEGRTALITGGGTGIGLQCARTLGASGARVVITGRREAVLEAAVQSLAHEGVDASAAVVDVTDARGIAEAMAAVASDGIDVLINNAGVTSALSLDDLDERTWGHVLDTNLKGAWLVAREFQRLAVARGIGGSIVNVASILGLCVQKGTGAYTASKAALIYLTRQMAVEWAKHGIRANAVLPGYFATDMADDFLASEAGRAMIRRVPARRAGKPKDLAGAVLLLASDASRYMTGSTITVDGGMSIPVV